MQEKILINTSFSIMPKESPLDYKKIIERMVEEAGVKNPRRLDDLIGTPESYVYSQMERGVSKTYLEKYIQACPDADLNYIFTGRRSNIQKDPREAVLALINQLVDDKSVVRELTQNYDTASEQALQNLPRDIYYREVLQLLMRLLSIALEK